MNAVKKLESRLNSAKTSNPAETLAALKISTGWIGSRITVSRVGNKYYAGAGSDEFCTLLGSSEAECNSTLDSLGM